MKKKVYVVTVYNSLNPGSFLQATALYRVLNNAGYEVSFLKTGARSLFKQAIIESIYMIKKMQITSVISKFISAHKFAKRLSSYKVRKTFDRDKDIFVLGSDEIWNVSRKNMAQHPIFWGEGLPIERCVSYAPSINNATEIDLNKYSFVKQCLDKMHAISVRDSYSKTMLNKFTNKNIVQVCDPTVLLPREEYLNFENECPYSNYILVYIYNKAVSKQDIDAIVEFAKKKNKKLISFGANYKWCDINVKGEPYDFISYIHHADYVCTSTFHGTMLSIIYQKQFAVLGKKNRKVLELLETVKLSTRQADAFTLNEILELDYNHKECEARLDELRRESIEFLMTSIETI